MTGYSQVDTLRVVVQIRQLWGEKGRVGPDGPRRLRARWYLPPLSIAYGTFVARARTPGLQGTERLRSPCSQCQADQSF